MKAWSWWKSLSTALLEPADQQHPLEGAQRGGPPPSLRHLSCSPPLPAGPRQVRRLQQLRRLLQLARGCPENADRAAVHDVRRARPGRARPSRTARSAARRRPTRRPLRIVGISRWTMTGARPSESSSISTNAAGRPAPGRARASAARRRRASARWRSSRFSSSGNSSQRVRAAGLAPRRGTARRSRRGGCPRRVSSDSSRRPSGTTATPACRICSGRRPARSRSPFS